jgi:hypothetical protein
MTTKVTRPRLQYQLKVIKIHLLIKQPPHLLAYFLYDFKAGMAGNTILHQLI